MLTKSHLAAGVVGLSMTFAFFSAAQAQQVAAPPQEPPAPKLSEYTQAQRLLYASNHLKAVGVSDVVNYTFSTKGSMETPFDDTASVTVASVGENGKKNLSVNFLTGAHHIDVPPMEGFNGNPILMIFLEHDVKEMSELTKGSTLYFRNRIRDAFATEEKATIAPTTVTVDGKQVTAKLLTLEPFVGLQELKRSETFAKFEHKSYQFIIGDDVPGGIYSIKTVTPPEAGKTEPALIETLAYQSKTKS